MRWEFTVENREQVTALLRKLPGALAAAMKEHLKLALDRFKEIFTDKQLHGRPGLNRVTGDLIHSFVVRVSGSSSRLESLTAWIASRSKYAGIHETGGTVRSKRPGGYLAIPLPGTKAPSGVIKGSFVAGMIPEGDGMRQSLRSIPGLFVVGSGEGSSWKRGATFREGLKKGTKGMTFGPRGQALLCMARGKSIVPLFVLKKQVYIPARLKFFETFRKWAGSLNFKVYIREAVTAAWKKAKA